MSGTFDCVVCGSCVVDILVRPVPLDRPIGRGQLVHTDPIEATTGGIVSNSGIAMARLGMRVAAFSYIGGDAWGRLIRRAYEAESIETAHLIEHPTEATSTTAVLIDPSGERTFLHCVGAPRRMDGDLFRRHMDLFVRSRMALIGYYSLMPNLEGDLPEVLGAIRAAGCMTALDAAGDGGTMEPLAKVLPHLDVYVPSRAEASHQTGESDPRRIIEAYRECGAPGLLGVKLGAAGALLSPGPDEWVETPPVEPPGEVVDTTGAGDCFYAGLLTGLLRGLEVAEAGRLAAAAGACCVTAVGANAGLLDYNETRLLAGLGSASR